MLMSADIKNLLDFKSPLLFPSLEAKQIWWRTKRNNPEFQTLFDEIRLEGKRLLKEKEPELAYSLFKLFADTGSRIEFEKVYFEKRRRLTTFAIMVLLEPETDEYKEALENTIWSVCNEYSWCLPSHLQNSWETSTNNCFSLHEPYQPHYTIDLFAAETGFALAEILHLTEEYLNPLIRKRIYEEVYRRIFHPFTKTRFDWETQTHNWAAVCAGSIGAAALYLINDAAALAYILERVLPAMESYLSGFNNDGICLEGYAYWQYGFGYFVYFTDLLKKRTAGKLDLFASEKVHQIALFQQKCFLHGNQVVNFSDAKPDAYVFLGLSHYLSRLYPDVEIPSRDLRAKFTDDHCSRWAPAIRNLLWFDETAPGKAWGSGTIFSRESGWLISKYHSEFGSFSFAAKGGHNNEPHNHNDLGHFMLHENSEVFVKDLGSGLYTKDYFGDKRYSFLCNGSQGHSVPIINHQFQEHGSDRLAAILNIALAEDVDIFELDIAKAYDVPALKALTRKFLWMKQDRPKLVMTDAYSFTEQPISIIERVIIPAISVTEGEDEVILQGKQRLRILYDRRRLFLEVKKLDFINHSGEIEDILALDFIVLKPEKQCSVELMFQFDS